MRKTLRRITCVYLSKTYFYTSNLRLKFTPSNYARIAGVIFTDNYVKKIRFTPTNYEVEFYGIIRG